MGLVIDENSRCPDCEGFFQEVGWCVNGHRMRYFEIHGHLYRQIAKPVPMEGRHIMLLLHHAAEDPSGETGEIGWERSPTKLFGERV